RARDAGLVVGFYHFLWPGDLTAQAEHFLGEAPLRPGDVLAADWETTGGGTRASAAEQDRSPREAKERAQEHRDVLYADRAAWRFHQYTDDPLDRNVADFADEAALREWAEGA